MNRDRCRDHADCRPRIHVRKEQGGASYSFHPAGPRTRVSSVGAAIEDALDRVERMPAVIFYEGEQGADSLPVDGTAPRLPDSR